VEIDERPKALGQRTNGRHLPVERAATPTIRPHPTARNTFRPALFGKATLHNRLGLARSNRPGVGTLAEKELERADECRLARTCLPAHYGHTGRELQPHLFDEREILDVELLDHRAPPKNSSATVW
jgi:hypothetical protein